MQKLFIIILVLLAGAAGLVYFLMDKEKVIQPGAPQADKELAGYFQERIAIVASTKHNVPITSFDANLLITLFPGFSESDLQNVETENGAYELRGTSIAFVAEASSANIDAGTVSISKRGFSTLLFNIAKRLNIEPTSTADVDKILTEIQKPKS